MMTIKATQVQEIELTIRKCNIENEYPYALIAPNGETIGWLREWRKSIYVIARLYSDKIRIEKSMFWIENDELIDTA